MTSATRAAGRPTEIRGFFAVDLDAGARAAAAAASNLLRARVGSDLVRWVRPESYHVTLRFLGRVAPDALGGLCEAVAEEIAPLPAFGLQLAERMALPDRNRPRVLAMDLTPHAPLVALAGAVERGVVRGGFEAEARRPLGFRPHVTLGRIRRGATAPQARAIAEALREDPIVAESFPVDEVVLFRSELRPDGAVYTLLERIRLASSETHSLDSFHRASALDSPHSSHSSERDALEGDR